MELKNNKSPYSKYLQWLLVFIFIVQFASPTYALGGGMFIHNFGFDTLEDSPNIEILDFQYGNSGQYGTYADKHRVSEGKIFAQSNTHGAMPKGEFLYVKWRIKESGQIYEDKVNLKTRLPENIDNCGIRPVIRGTQLYIYVIPPPGIFPALGVRRAVNQELAVKMGSSSIEASNYLKQHQI